MDKEVNYSLNPFKFAHKKTPIQFIETLIFIKSDKILLPILCYINHIHILSWKSTRKIPERFFQDAQRYTRTQCKEDSGARGITAYFFKNTSIIYVSCRCLKSPSSVTSPILDFLSRSRVSSKLSRSGNSCPNPNFTNLLDREILPRN